MMPVSCRSEVDGNRPGPVERSRGVDMFSCSAAVASPACVPAAKPLVMAQLSALGGSARLHR